MGHFKHSIRKALFFYVLNFTKKVGFLLENVIPINEYHQTFEFQANGKEESRNILPTHKRDFLKWKM